MRPLELEHKPGRWYNGSTARIDNTRACLEETDESLGMLLRCAAYLNSHL